MEFIPLAIISQLFTFKFASLIQFIPIFTHFFFISFDQSISIHILPIILHFLTVSFVDVVCLSDQFRLYSVDEYFKQLSVLCA